MQGQNNDVRLQEPQYRSWSYANIISSTCCTLTEHLAFESSSTIMLII